MKNHILKRATLALSALFVLTFAATSALAQTQGEEGVGITSLSIMFCNPSDAPRSVPYLEITFKNVPKSKIPDIITWRTEISDKLNHAGGVYTKADYGKLEPLLTEYFVRFKDTGASSVEIDYPRIKMIRE